jgi:NACalpha-BTF3-like transcription factor
MSSFLDPANGKGRVVRYACGAAAGIVVIFEFAGSGIWIRRKCTEPGKRRNKDAVREISEEDIKLVAETTKDDA